MALTLPEGFDYHPEFVSEEEESELLRFAVALPFRTFEFRGYTALRRVIHFGWHYSFDSFRLTEAVPIPAELLPLRNKVAGVANVQAEDFAEALVTEYANGAGIGWHRDAAPFGIVAGVSLGSETRMRFQRGKGAERKTSAVVLERRSLYLLSGPARTDWEHSIPKTTDTRYSVTFRTLRKKR